LLHSSSPDEDAVRANQDLTGFRGMIPPMRRKRLQVVTAAEGWAFYTAARSSAPASLFYCGARRGIEALGLASAFTLPLVFLVSFASSRTRIETTEYSRSFWSPSRSRTYILSL